MAAVDKKHQVIVEAQAFGEGQEQHTLKPMLEAIKGRYQRTGISTDILKDQVVVTADTGFSNQDNDNYLKQEKINAYIPDNQFRSRDPKFKTQKLKYGKRHHDTVKGVKAVIPASDFDFNIQQKSCRCPAGNDLWLKNETVSDTGKLKLFFEGKLTDCRDCDLKHQCMRNPTSADTREGHGRQVSVTINTKRTATDWMKRRVDSLLGKQIYSHRNVGGRTGVWQHWHQ